MQRLLVAIIVLLLALLLARDPRAQRADEFFLSWLLRNTAVHGARVPLTVVEIGREHVNGSSDSNDATNAFLRGTSSGVSPLEFALFVQSLLELKPTVLAIEPLLRWRERDKDQEQIFLDQAMRIPKLLLGAELTAAPEPDAVPAEILGFAHVNGRRGNLPTFTGIAREPDEDLVLVSTPGFTNLPEETAIRVPLLFQYRSEVIPAFALQAFLTWARIPMSQVTVNIGSNILLPDGRKIPVGDDGSLLLNPNASKLARRLSLNELLALAQQKPPRELLSDQLVLARTPLNPLAPPDVFAAAIATMQSNHFVRRVGVVPYAFILLLIAALFVWPWRRSDLVLGAVALTAAYCLLSLTLMAAQQIWLPGVVALATLWTLTIFGLLWPRPRTRFCDFE